MRVWGILVEKAFREGDPAVYEYMAQNNLLTECVRRRQAEMNTIYEARLKAGDDNAEAVNSTIIEYVKQMEAEVKSPKALASQPETRLTVWSRRLRGALKRGDPTSYAYMKEKGTLTANLVKRLGELEVLYRASIAAGNGPMVAMESAADDLAAQMMDEEMTESEAEMIMDQWIASQGTK